MFPTGRSCSFRVFPTRSTDISVNRNKRDSTFNANAVLSELVAMIGCSPYVLLVGGSASNHCGRS